MSLASTSDVLLCLLGGTKFVSPLSCEDNTPISIGDSAASFSPTRPGLAGGGGGGGSCCCIMFVVVAAVLLLSSLRLSSNSYLDATV